MNHYQEGRDHAKQGRVPLVGRFLSQEEQDRYLAGYLAYIVEKLKESEERYNAFKQEGETDGRVHDTQAGQGAGRSSSASVCDHATAEREPGEEGHPAQAQVGGNRGGLVAGTARGTEVGGFGGLTDARLANLLTLAKAAHTQHEEHFRIEGKEPPAHSWEMWYARYILNELHKGDA